MAKMTRTGRSTWNTKLADDSTIAIKVSWWYEIANDKGQVTVDVVAGDGSWMETRKGELHIQRHYRSRVDAIQAVSVASLDRDVISVETSVKGAAEGYGSKVAQAIVEQRRRAKLVQAAAQLSNGQLFSVEMTRDTISALKVAIANAENFAALAPLLRQLDAITMRADGITR